MKIFNWVHRRFHNGALKDGLARNVKNAESITNEADKQALLKQVALVDVLDGWKDGILTIGTFGLDPLKPFNQPHVYEILESEDEAGEFDELEEQEQYTDDDDENDDVKDDGVYNDIVENEEVNPLLFTTFDQNFRDFEANVVVKSNDIETNEGVGLFSDREISSCVAENDQRKRITLAELFLADSDMKKKVDFDEIEVNFGKKKPIVRAKSGMFFAKKLIPRVGEDSRPIKKIQQLMRRMLKRKIHPELEGNKGFKAENQNKFATTEVLKEKAAESVSLLQNTSRPAI